jgi:rubrerythrin
MAILFSGQEIVEMAVGIERNGYAFYDETLKMAKSVKVKELLTYLRDEENDHAKTFQRLYGLLSPDAGPYGDEEALRYMKALADSRVFSDTNELMAQARNAKDEQTILRLAVGFEKESLLFFYGMLEWVEANEKKVVWEMIEEEKTHLEKLLQMLKAL